MRTWVFVCSTAWIALSVEAAENPPAAPPAEKIDWKICEKEARDYDCKGSDEEIWQCLEKKDEHLGDLCQKEHRKGDKRFGVVISPGDVRELK